MKKQKKIVCVVGESGTGKTLLTEYIHKKLKTNIILSFTDRPKRTEDEEGHKFISKRAFDKIKYPDMVARTKFGGHRYCTTHKDVRVTNLYVIDEGGIDFLVDTYPDIYNLYTIRVHRDISKRLESGVSEERIARDADNFDKEDSYYDSVIINNGTIDDFTSAIVKLIEESDKLKGYL